MNAPENLPFDLDHTDLQAFLQGSQRGKAVAIEAIRVEASNRRYFRIRYESSFDAMRVSNSFMTQSAILCVTKPILDPSSDDFIFLSSYLLSRGISVPKIIDLHADRGWLLLSDGGEADLITTRAQMLAEGRETDARMLNERVIELLVQWHQIEPAGSAAKRSFDFKKLYDEMIFLKEATDRACEHLGVSSPLSFEFMEFLRMICEKLGNASPLVFTHRDFHGRNILFDATAPKESSLTIIDYQDARMGLPWYDLASLLFDPYAPFDPKEMQQGFALYCDLMPKEILSSHNGGSSNGFKTLFYMQALQRILKALGSYIHLSFDRNLHQYKHSIEPALHRLECIIQLGAFPDLLYNTIIALRRILRL